MATRIRLARGGKKKHPYYRIVVADSRAPRDGKFIERIGSYDPLLRENKATVDPERARYWLGVGARPSQRVSKLLALQGVQHKLIVLPRPQSAPAGPAEPGAAPAAAKPKRKKGKGGADQAAAGGATQPAS